MTYISPKQLATMGSRLFGAGWNVRLADLLDLSRATIYRYVTGKEPVPLDRAMLLHLLVERMDKGHAPPMVKPAGVIRDNAFVPAERA